MGAEYAAQDRVATRHKVTFVMTLPKRYVEDIRQIAGRQGRRPGSTGSARASRPRRRVLRHHGHRPRVVPAGLRRDRGAAGAEGGLAREPQGALVGAQLARQFGWKVGDKVTLAGTIYPGDWEFTIEGIYTATRTSIDQSTFWFHWDYMNESPSLAPQMRDQIGWITSRVEGRRRLGARLQARSTSCSTAATSRR